MKQVTHSVTLETDKCIGCINCIKKCPTEAIRVRNGKATIMSDRCIDCGECIRVCPQHAKKAVYDPMCEMDRFKYKVALPAPTLYGQFKFAQDVDYVLAALLDIGFDDVYEVALAAQTISDHTAEVLPEAKKILRDPLISSACPAIIKLISIRFPELVDNVMKVIAPVELAAIAARREAQEKTGLPPEDIGVFFISPCPAKVTALKYPLTYDKPVVDGVLSMKEVYGKLIAALDKIDEPPRLSTAGFRGIGWASSGGESRAMGEELFIAVDGIQNVVKVLDEVETQKLHHVQFIELNACPGGCVGGCLTVENPYVARTRITRLSKMVKPELDKNGVDPLKVAASEVMWSNTLEYQPIMMLDADRGTAMRMMSEIEKTAATLPGLDCGSCGAPSCHALAEDIVMGIAQEGDCVFKLRERMQALFDEMMKVQAYMPPTFGVRSAETEEETAEKDLEEEKNTGTAGAAGTAGMTGSAETAEDAEAEAGSEGSNGANGSEGADPEK
ncbi:[Fe-Fe] hydrogenase large subunit C-terminal domain-containing protein [Bacilliculturomica massiliensis]|uniref:[Fe-Fe] hydrogenase large subunit C-terminal domain-containing protein n=1 Tax=Bacilliculturomica massiliensis TaxID=1917867 RepID=UPI001031B2A9|nr:[Fe-Fe] hydrogenase large subunit C-terminal domain-containing protein [Bacilliculturomica massiliensis]